jgi:hypothetical protein
MAVGSTARGLGVLDAAAFPALALVARPGCPLHIPGDATVSVVEMAATCRMTATENERGSDRKDRTSKTLFLNAAM